MCLPDTKVSNKKTMRWLATGLFDKYLELQALDSNMAKGNLLNSHLLNLLNLLTQLFDSLISITNKKHRVSG